MRKPITYLNLALLTLAMWVAAAIHDTWQSNHARYKQFVTSAATPGPGVSKAGMAEAGLAAVPDSYSVLLTRNLFSPDRNNDQALASVSKVRPPVPLVIGTLNLGSGPVALMAEPQQARQATFRRLKVGDEIGGYRVAEIAEHQVVIEFEGQKTTIDVYESAENVRQAAGRAAVRPARPAGTAADQVLTAVPAAPSASSAGPASTPAPGAATAPAVAPATGSPTGDRYLTVTVEGNRKRYDRVTPFGVQTWYEDLPAAQKTQ